MLAFGLVFMGCGGGSDDDGSGSGSGGGGGGGGSGYTIANASSSDLLAKFGVSTAGEAFTSLHNLISAPATGDDFTAIIALGDYIDLPSLTIAGTPAITDTELTGHGRLLRLMVVGINSFQANGSYTGVSGAPDHVVFQFQNLPITRQMDAAVTNANGYLGSEMRTWLTGAFLTGLKAATGLTDTVLSECFVRHFSKRQNSRVGKC
jgi:hypothetical protein